ncbi:MAG: hypothetical protein Q9187_006326 [Circinaria calcarea]
MAMPAPLDALVAASRAALKAHECGRLVLQKLAADHAGDDGVGGGGVLGEELARETFGALKGEVLASEVGDGVTEAEFHTQVRVVAGRRRTGF